MNSHDEVDWRRPAAVAGALTTAALWFMAAGCTGSNSPSPTGFVGLGAAKVDIELVPTGTSCIIIKVVGPGTTPAAISYQYTITPQTNAEYLLVDLPLGNDTFSATSYSVPCPTGTTPPANTQTYVSNSSTTAISTTPATVTLYMGNGTGEGSVVVNFPGVSITEIELGHGSAPWGIVSGPDGNLWFTLSNSTGVLNPVGYVGQMTSDGVVTWFATPTAASQPQGITAGPDGYLWFTESLARMIGRCSTSGSISEFALPSRSASGNPITNPADIVAGPDGNLWFTDGIGAALDSSDTEQIGTIATSGVIASADVFDLTIGGQFLPLLSGIAVGADGNLWSIDYQGLAIYVSSTSGALLNTYHISSTVVVPANGQYGFQGIAAGPDGNLWFTSATLNMIGQITTAGVITPFAIPTANSEPAGIAAGPDGNLWFTEFAGNKIGRITPSGVMTEYPIPTAGSGPIGITAGPDSNVWFTESAGGRIGKISLF